jgi:hypothetical protein
MAIVIHIEAADAMELDIALERIRSMGRAPNVSHEPVTELPADGDTEDQDTARAVVDPAPAAPPRKRRTKAEIEAEKAAEAAANKTVEKDAPASVPAANASPAPTKPAGDDPAFDAPRAELRQYIQELMGLGMTPDDVKKAFFVPINVAKIPDMTLVQLSDALDTAKKLKASKTTTAAAEFA